MYILAQYLKKNLRYDSLGKSSIYKSALYYFDRDKKFNFFCLG